MLAPVQLTGAAEMRIVHFRSVRGATASWHVLITSALARTKTPPETNSRQPSGFPSRIKKLQAIHRSVCPALRREVTATRCQGCNHREQHEPESEAGASEP